MSQPVIAPGANILVRDAAWRVRQVDVTSSGGQAIHAVGISELVQDKETIFLSEYERSIEVLDPETTELVADDSSNFQASRLYMESQLRRIPPTDDNLYIGHKAAMDPLEYQLDPAAQALAQPRQRILIADAVGLGKTLEAGILLSELIARGKGKRILVVAVKSMLTQFQKELWSRFTIPLVRLDSLGLQRIRQRIPTNQNPFYYYDKAIVSVDTLKQNNEYRTYLEDAYWDVIVIDEAHNVAVRGNKKSQRAKLAELLSHRSDTLLMLSATPHDGKAKSFASLMNMLDPTAIADEENYTPDDIDGLYIRRFKKDVSDQVADSFPDREIYEASTKASLEEEEDFEAFAELEFDTLDQHSGGHMLFKTSLEKALLSSPAACIDTIDNRIKRLERKTDDDRYTNDPYKSDKAQLESFRNKLEAVGPEHFAKYQKLVQLLDEDPFSFTGYLRTDRIVIFTERIATMEWLAEHLPKALDLDERKVETLHGGMSDIDQQRIVEDFGKEKADVRLLIASDVASEGINLHYYCHRMIHFDIPWSLLVFQQRNGRIDRYGQTETPYIAYLYTESENERINGDTRILELLIQKDEQASHNIGDPSALMGVYDIDEQEKITAGAIESGQGAEGLDSQLQEMDIVSQMLAAADEAEKQKRRRPTPKDLPSIYSGDFDYLRHALDYLREERSLEYEADPEERRIALQLTDDLERRFEKLPDEVLPDDRRVILSADPVTIQRSIVESRAEESAWPSSQYLWRLNPIVQWANDRMAGNFGRHSAPVVILDQGLDANETVFLLSGLIPNRKSQPLIHEWFGVVFADNQFQRVERFEAVRNRLRLNRSNIPNRQDEFDAKPLQALLPKAVEAARKEMLDLRSEFEDRINPRLNDELARLETLRKRQLDFQQELFGDRPSAENREKLERKNRETDQLFDEYYEWIEDTMTTEKTPFIQVIAAFITTDDTE
jgi:SNF2 family DNA or RNA helicase